MRLLVYLLFNKFNFFVLIFIVKYFLWLWCFLFRSFIELEMVGIWIGEEKIDEFKGVEVSNYWMGICYLEELYSFLWGFDLRV